MLHRRNTHLCTMAGCATSAAAFMSLSRYWRGCTGLTTRKGGDRSSLVAVATTEGVIDVLCCMWRPAVPIDNPAHVLRQQTLFRYLWSDAFGVCDFLSLYKETGNVRFLDQVSARPAAVHAPACMLASSRARLGSRWRNSGCRFLVELENTSHNRVAGEGGGEGCARNTGQDTRRQCAPGGRHRGAPAAGRPAHWQGTCFLCRALQ